MSKFRLFAGCFGNGVVYCNAAIKEHGDYKKLCHVLECGKIKWYVKPESIPGDVLLKIEHQADVYRANWENSINKDITKAYARLLNLVPLNVMLKAINMNSSVADKVEYLKNVYLDSM